MVALNIIGSVFRLPQLRPKTEVATTEFAAIIAVARFGGLITPSEFRHLKHGDFFNEGGCPAFKIYCQKTAHTGKPLLLRTDTKKATPNTEWLYALERTLAS